MHANGYVPRRITIVQYSGDFRQAAERLAEGGKETYRAQRYTVDFVHGLALTNTSVTVITAVTPVAYDVLLPSGVRAIGAGFIDGWKPETILRLIASASPDRVVLRTPRAQLLRGIVGLGVPTLAMLADSFQAKSLRDCLKVYVMVHYLKNSVIERIGNHGLNAARQLVALGVPKEKISAWDYPPLNTPSERPPKRRAKGRTVIYVGMLEATKGVDDLLVAISAMSKRGTKLQLELVGAGDRRRLETVVERLQIEGLVQFAGVVPNDEIIDRMAAADVVVIPSRHVYPEGLPLTIYEAFCSRTPLVVSDHPMFVNNVEHEKSGLVFRAGDSIALGENVTRLLNDEALYQSLSVAADAAWRRIQVPYTWGSMISDWLHDSPPQQPGF